MDKAGDLIFMTYYMVDWKTAKQSPSDQKCAECGQVMSQVESAVDSKGQEYEGYACHTDKRLVWVRAR